MEIIDAAKTGDTLRWADGLAVLLTEKPYPIGDQYVVRGRWYRWTEDEDGPTYVSEVLVDCDDQPDA